MSTDADGLREQTAVELDELANDELFPCGWEAERDLLQLAARLLRTPVSLPVEQGALREFYEAYEALHGEASHQWARTRNEYITLRQGEYEKPERAPLKEAFQRSYVEETAAKQRFKVALSALRDSTVPTKQAAPGDDIHHVHSEDK